MHFDPFLGEEDLRRIYHMLVEGRWDEFDHALDTNRSPWLVEDILTSDDAAVEAIFFERFHDAMPSARSFSMLGAVRARDAWQMPDAIDAKTSDATVEQVNASFQSALREAEATLHEAVRLRPAMAGPWIHLISTGRGLGVELQELRNRFENAHSRVPYRPDACREYLLSLSTRRGGADVAMFDFARWLEAEAPPDSGARITLPIAHLEHGLGDDSTGSLTEHLSRDETVEELIPGLDAFLQASRRNAGPAELRVLNTYALAMTVLDRRTAELVEECFRRIDNRPTSYPWSLYVGEKIVDVFNEIRRTQLRGVERFL